MASPGDSMEEDNKQVFYASKPRILHMAANITLAPLLL